MQRTAFSCRLAYSGAVALNGGSTAISGATDTAEIRPRERNKDLPAGSVAAFPDFLMLIATMKINRKTGVRIADKLTN